ncbi:hypothetical protein QJS66_00090 [Kocuria rhizophila]|nr:hypothetical protein QJS66_00090 [Kocuria rhizophila]
MNLRVSPATHRVSTCSAGVRGAYNAVFVEAASAGPDVYGEGAGGEPTASAVLGTWSRRHAAIALGAQGDPARTDVDCPR